MDAKAYHRKQLMRIAEHANNSNKSHLAVYLGEAADHIDAMHAKLEAAKTLRDEFAMAAITGTLPGAAIGDERVKEYAQWAYKMADAMLEARNANR